MKQNFNIPGLTDAQVLQSRQLHGSNTLDFKKDYVFLKALKNLIKDPMVILLLAASLIYFVSGDKGDGIFLAGAIVFEVVISLYQDSRSRNALVKLKQMTKPSCKVIRNGKIVEIKIEELVIDDCLMVEEGCSVSADASIIQSNDFAVNESILTGESFSIEKDNTKEDHFIYQGTIVTNGLAIATITSIGINTKLGKIGESLQSIKEEKTPLELQINNFVKKMAIVGAVFFIIVWIANYYRSHFLLDSLLQALTLAMSILPEEIPVALTTFMALGAWRLMKIGVVVKQMKTVETLGSATVICTDKTGTITENKMTLVRLYVLADDQIINPNDVLNNEAKQLIYLAMWASEPIPFDPMEFALHQAYQKTMLTDERPNYSMIHEYPLEGKPPMMTHVFQNASGLRIIASKGAPEAILSVCKLTAMEQQQLNNSITKLTNEGYRVLAVAESFFDSKKFPSNQHELVFICKGIVAFYDPPKKNIEKVLSDFYTAGIAVKIVTGDNTATTTSIANQIRFVGSDKSITGDELMLLSEEELKKTVQSVYVFTRMFPEAKLKIINALKAQNEIVAMTGDGVNDGPALKAAHIGIAMGKKGSEIAKEAASLILQEDDLSKMVLAIAMGRKIYANLKKAIQYIISIHIPIVLTVFIPLTLGWLYPNIFSPVHIIFLELVMGPTCSIIYENEPIEKNTMNQKPRPFSSTFFNWKELTTSVIQGLVITLGTLSVYQYAVYLQYDEAITRTMVFIVLITANVFLTLVNRSFYYSVFVTMLYKNWFVGFIISFTIIITAALLYIPPFTKFFKFQLLNLAQLGVSIGIGFISVIWYELIKWRKRLIKLV